MATVRDLFEICDYTTTYNKKLVAIVDRKKYPVCSHYIESEMLYFFTGETNQLNGENVDNFIVTEAQRSEWYDWQNGSRFLDCDMFFFNFAQNYDANYFYDEIPADVDSINETDDEIQLICY